MPHSLPISFITPLADVHVYEKDEAKFELEISREPKSFRWLKGTQELSNNDKFEIQADGKQHTLVVKAARYEDEAKYMFEAEDKRTSGKLIIKGKMSWCLCILSHRNIIIWTPVTEECECLLKLWLCLLKALGKHLQTSTQPHNHNLPNWNNIVFTSCKCNFLSGIRLEFIKPIKDVTVKERETAEFSVELSHDKIPVVWYRNEVRLHPKGDLYFTVKLQNYTAVEKDEAILSCELSKAAAEVKWFKDGNEIFASRNVLFQSDGRKRMLIIKKSAKKDRGAYTCNCGTDKTTAELNIEEPPVEFTKPLQDQTVVEGHRAEFTCIVSKETFSVKWMKDGNELESGDKYELVSDGKKRSLVIKASELKDEGGYVVVIGETRASADLTVSAKLKVITPLRDTEVKEGQEVVLNCEVNIDGAKAKWLKNEETLWQVSIRVIGERLINNPFVSTGLLNFKYFYTHKSFHSVQEQVLQQLLVATLKREKDVQFLNLCPLPAVPQIKTTDQSYVTDAGKPIVLAVPYSAYPQAEADWLYDNQSVSKDNIYTSAERTEYRLKDPKKSDQGRYKIVIKNKHGQGEAFINLDVIDVPEAPLNVDVGNVTKFGCTVSWDPPVSDGGSPITSYIVELRDRTSVKWSPVQVTKAGELSAIINDVIENKEYIFRVKAENKAGEGKPSAASRPVKIMDPIGEDWTVNYVYYKISIPVSLTWETPLKNGGSIITGYIIERCEEGTNKWLRSQICVQLLFLTSLPVFQVSGLKYGTKYNYRVFAENAAGVSEPSNVIGPLLADDPHLIVPQPLTIRVPITGYPTPVAKWTFGEKELTTADERVSLMTKSTFTELMITPINVIAAPSAPKDFKVLEVTRQHVHLSWEAPEHDGGSPLTGYQVEKRDVSRKTWPCGDTVPELKCQVTGLIEGEWYAYRVRALNRLGASRPCKPTDEIQAVDPIVFIVILSSEAPEIQLDAKLLAGLTAKAGSKIELPAEVKGKPEPRVKWTKADLVLKPDDRVSIDTKPGHSTVTVAKTKRDDSSTYIIEATNSSGRATATVDVNILGEKSLQSRNVMSISV
uniref:Uncharacterized protein n=1 Tax=Xiphophorus maculatus TaxID=8083 RepID=A0A3B5RET8_XIPMA